MTPWSAIRRTIAATVSSSKGGLGRAVGGKVDRVPHPDSPGIADHRVVTEGIAQRRLEELAVVVGAGDQPLALDDGDRRVRRRRCPGVAAEGVDMAKVRDRVDDFRVRDHPPPIGT